MRKLSGFDLPAAALRGLLAVLPVLAACGDGATATDGPGASTPPRGTLAVLSCTARVAEASVACDPATPALPGGARADLRLLGGQGSWVRLTSSNVVYSSAAQQLSFNVTVRNLTTLPFATADGATPHADGVRVFFAAPPVVTQGSGTVTVLNATGQADFTATGQKYFQYGGTVGGTTLTDLGADGILTSGEVSAARGWQLSVPTTATTFTFQLYVATEMPSGPLESVAPQVTSISPDTLVPGATATLTGYNFNPAWPVDTVYIGGVAVQVTGGSETSLTVRVPCLPAGVVPVQVTHSGLKGAAVGHPLKTTPAVTLAPGEWTLVSDPTAVGCTELAAANGPATYVLAVFNQNPSPAAKYGIAVWGGAPGGPPVTGSAVRAPAPSPVSARASRPAAADPYARVREANRRAFARLSRGAAAAPARAARARAVITPPAQRTFRVPNPLAANSCTTFSTVTATRVYYNGKIAIYEDNATSSEIRAANNTEVAGYYQKVGDQFNADIEPIIRQNFGDPLRRDTDQDGVVDLVVSPAAKRNSVPAAFSSACDLYPNDQGTTAQNTASNYGEVVYSGTADGTDQWNEYYVTPRIWYRELRDPLVRETYNIAAHAAHLANGHAFMEEAWLDEALAKTAVELYARTWLFNVPWKGNGVWVLDHSTLGPWCYYRPEIGACLSNPRSPVRVAGDLWVGTNIWMMYSYGNPYSVWNDYAAQGWLLLRYTVDRFAQSESDFLTELTQAGTTGIDNLTARAGIGRDQLLARWMLAMYADDDPILPSPPADLSFPAWNLPDINRGVNQDDTGPYGMFPAVPLQPEALGFGSFPLRAFRGDGSFQLGGGNVVYYRFTGTQTAPQTFGVRSPDGSAPASDLRIAIVRMK